VRNENSSCEEGAVSREQGAGNTRMVVFVARMERMVKRRKNPSQGKRNSFHALYSSSDKCPLVMDFQKTKYEYYLYIPDDS